jgi:hypothetical protein
VLIVVGVAEDTMRQLEAQPVMRNYREFIGPRSRQTASPARVWLLARIQSRRRQAVYGLNEGKSRSAPTTSRSSVFALSIAGRLSLPLLAARF